MIIVDEKSIKLTEEDVQTIITAVEQKLNGITLSDIEPETDENSYSVTEDELEIESLPGITVYIDWTADYWYKTWTEYWTDPVCYPEFDDGGINDVWCDAVSLEGDYDIEDCDKISKRISDEVYAREKAAYDKRKAKEKAARERRLAVQMARYEAQKANINSTAV